MRWKLLLSILAFLVVTAVLTAYLVVSRYDFNALKPEISRAIKAATGRDLEVSGDIITEIGLTPTLVVSGVTFANASWGSRPVMVAIERIEVKVAILPLLQKRIEVRRMILVGPDVLIETNASGESNFPRPPVESAKAVPPVSRSPDGEAAAGAVPAVLWVNDLRIENGRLSYRDGASGKTRVVSLESFTASAAAPDSPVRVTAHGAFGDRPFQVDGTLGSLQVLTDPAKTWTWKLGANIVGTTVAVEGEAEDILHGKRLAMNVDIQGKSVPDLAGMAGMAGVPDVGPFKAAARVTVQKDVLGVEKLDVEMGGGDPALLKLTGSIKDLRGMRGIDVSLDIQGPDLSKAGQVAGATFPAAAPFQVSAHIVDPAEGTFRIADFKGNVGESNLRGTLDVAVRGTRPSLDGSLSSTQLDLRPFITRSPGKSGRAGGPKRERVFSNRPFSMPPLTRMDARLRLRAESVLAPRWTASDLDLELMLKDGKLTVNPFKAALWGGTVDGHLDMGTRGTTIHLHPVLKAGGSMWAA